MKHFFKIVSLLFIGFLIISCEKDEEQAILGQGTIPTLKADKTNLILLKDNEADIAVKFDWTNPKFETQVALKNALEFSIAGTNFQSIKSVDVSAVDLSATYTVSALNKIMLDAGLLPNVANQVEVRMKSSVGSIVLYSNTVALTVTPYLTEFPSFYLVGEASAVGWNAGSAQLLYKNESTSTIYTYLENGKSFRFLGQQDWNPLNYSLDAAGIQDANKYFKTWSSNFVAAPAENIQFTGATGMYKIVINADPTLKSIEATPSAVNNWNPTNLYLVGTVNGWNAGTAIPMTSLGDGKFEHTISLSAGTQIKFLGQQSWGDLDWGNISADGNTGYLGPKGSNGNITFDGTGGSYKISVDVKLGIYKIQPL
ncbi:SusE domain-containing protein [Chryseobacterium oryctis]|uniref:SusE domain-containing protein n=1 Tax=Chryseobacterium oryctis TaxID=2952618 RepID=A0ABT3HS41_9FLAO|nr:SusE domain-containing protein [Chryseobacterium oryctis]MCW3162607.1 SusE domain-containing protein [Chryseobacterium oryctis]